MMSATLFEDKAFAPRVHATPIVRWVGGKRWLVPIISDIVYEYLQRTGGRYIEPFLGGGAVAADLGLPGMILSDLCEPLMNAFQQVQKDPAAVLWALASNYVKRGTDDQTYYKVRAEKPQSALQRAAWFFYLNATAFNGIWRENASGVFNVPYGRRKGKTGPAFLNEKRLRPFVEATQDAELLTSDFRPVIERADSGDFLFVDSPYFGVYSNYLKEGFGPSDHVDLARALQAAVARGAAFVATNNDLPDVRRLYGWANMTRTGEFRRVNRDAAGRGKVACLLITSTPDLLHHAVR